MKAATYRSGAVSEHTLQASVLRHLEQRAGNCYWFAIPNAARRSPGLAARMRAEGLRAGVADLAIMLPGGRTGWLELKNSKGRQSDAQAGFEAICGRLGHGYAVARTLDEAIAVLGTWGALT
jgi:hypothetical protein